MLGSGFTFGLGQTLGRVAARAIKLGGYVKNNLKIYFDFKSSRAKTLEFVGTGSASFDGTNDYITYNDADTKDALEGGDELTVMGWCSRLAQGGTIINKGAYYTASTNWGMEFQNHSNNRWRFSIAQGITFWCAPPGDIENSAGNYTGVWHHYAITYNKNASANNLACNMYIDGELQGETASGTLASISSDDIDITIGANNSAGSDLNGKVKNCGVWNRVLSASEIQNIMYKSYADLKGSELTHLQFWADLDSDLHAKDNAGDAITGTASNEAAVSTSQYGNNIPRKPRGFDNAPTAQADLIGSGSALLNGSSDYISFGTNFTGTTLSGNYSITAWIKPGAYSYETLFGSGGAGQDKEDYIQFINTTTMRVEQDGTGGSGTLTHGHTFTTDEWQHFAFTRDADNSNTIKVYRNGIAPSGTITGAGTFKPDLLGGANATVEDFLNANICQVGMWSKVLTQEEIQSIKEKTYSDLTTSEKTNLVSWWGLDALKEKNAVEDYHTTETLGANLCADVTWINSSGNPIESFTSSGNEVTQADNSSGWGIAYTTNFTLVSGTTYKVTFNFTKVSGTDPNYIRVGSGTDVGSTPQWNQGTGTQYGSDGTAVPNGLQSYYFVSTRSGTCNFGVRENSAVSWTLSDLSINAVTASNTGVLL